MKKISIWYVMIFTLVIGFNSCDEIEDLEDCPVINIDVDNVTGSVVYRFVAQLDAAEDIRFIWSIDGEEIDAGGLENVTGQILDYQFEEGKYTVCVKVASDTCPVQICKSIEVIKDETNPCPDLFFDTRQYERPSQYKFIADFDGIEETYYEWFINGELVESVDQSDDEYLIWEFTAPGRYEVCINSESETCPNGASYCKVIEVEEKDERCPEISFTKEIVQGTDGVYIFTAEIVALDQVSELYWYVDDTRIENSTNGQNEEGVLEYQFEEGVHEVCLKVFTEECPDGVIYCKEIVMGDAVTECPDLFFVTEQQGDSSSYAFHVDFEGANKTEWLGWFINGEFIEDSSKGDHSDFYYEFEPGTYEVCLKTETPTCPEGTSYCVEIVVEESGYTCPELFFEAEQDGDNPAYYFYTGAFDWTDDVVITLGWSINGAFVGTSSGDNDPFYYQFNSGTYEVCVSVETPDCPKGVSYCKTVVVE